MHHLMSSPSWGRGLKYIQALEMLQRTHVVPLVGTWIEIILGYENPQPHLVVPLVGTWIEITVIPLILEVANLSSPSWGRGLK